MSFQFSELEIALKVITEFSTSNKYLDFYIHEALYDENEVEYDLLSPPILPSVLNSTFALPEDLYFDETAGDIFSDDDQFQQASAKAHTPTSALTVQSTTVDNSNNSSNTFETILSDTRITCDSKAAKRARNQRRNEKKRVREKLDPVLRSKKKEAKRLKYMRRACQFYMSIEFSLCFRLAVLFKYERIAEICERYGNKIDFEPVFQNWLTEKYWLRFHIKGMYFLTVLRRHTRKNHLGDVYRNVCDVNETNWKSVLKNPEAGTVRLDEMTWQVKRICCRRNEIRKHSMSVSKVNRLQYLVEWKAHNGRYFQK